VTKPTIYDIAKLAGVSTATVSKVFNKTGRISERTSKRILEISEKFNYQPSVVASALTGKKTYTLGLLIPDLANPFFAEVARHVEDRANELGFNVVICNTDNDEAKETKYIGLLRQKSVDGIIVATGIRNDALMKELLQQRIPVALIARDLSLLSVSAVLVDDFAGAFNATEHLLGLRHRRIAIVSERLDMVSSKERVRGYRQALEQAGIEFNESYVLESDFTIEGGKRAGDRLLQSDGPPTAVFACNDLLAIGVMQAAKERNLSVPEQLSIVGFDNTILATIPNPPLTTVAQPIQAMGRQVVDLIHDEMNGNSLAKQRIVLLPELIVRGSTAPLIGGK
jgi:DNA-binding LacI/PurR family transcriptional regulator